MNYKGKINVIAIINFVNLYEFINNIHNISIINRKNFL